jgi:formamidopyrimidine-DNA glycosylase
MAEPRAVRASNPGTRCRNFLEVETVCRGLALRLVGRRLVRVIQRRGDLRSRPGTAKRLEGRTVTCIRRRAKYMIWELDDGQALIGHLGMSGRMLVGECMPEILDAHDHLLFQTEDGACVRFNDARRFGMMDLVATEGLERHKLLRGLGPEPLEAIFDAARLEAALGGKKTTIKAALLDQRVVAGLGNIYVSEALFRAGISPRRQARSVRGERARNLVLAIKAVLSEAVKAGGSSLRDYVRTDGELGYFQHQWRVYDREGGPCRGCDCDIAASGGVRRVVQAGRSTFYCPRRQR